jgi:hypothetical protein
MQHVSDKSFHDDTAACFFTQAESFSAVPGPLMQENRAGKR